MQGVLVGDVLHHDGGSSIKFYETVVDLEVYVGGGGGEHRGEQGLVEGGEALGAVQGLGLVLGAVIGGFGGGVVVGGAHRIGAIRFITTLAPEQVSHGLRAPVAPPDARGAQGIGAGREWSLLLHHPFLLIAVFEVQPIALYFSNKIINDTHSQVDGVLYPLALLIQSLEDNLGFERFLLDQCLRRFLGGQGTPSFRLFDHPSGHLPVHPRALLPMPRPSLRGFRTWCFG